MPQVESSKAIAVKGVGRRDYSKNVARFDVEPNLLLFEDFENLPLTGRGDGSAGYSIERVTDHAWRGGACLKLTTGTALANNRAEYYQEFGFVETKKILLDLAFTVPLNTIIDSIWFQIHNFTGAHHLIARARYMVPEEKWISDIGDVPSGAQRLAQWGTIFHRIHLAADFEAEKYLYLRCNDKIMSGIGGSSLYKVADLADPYSAIGIAYYSDDSLQTVSYIDNIRVAELK